MTDSKTYIFGEQGNSSLNALLPFLQQRGIDPAYVAGLGLNAGDLADYLLEDEEVYS